MTKRFIEPDFQDFLRAIPSRLEQLRRDIPAAKDISADAIIEVERYCRKLKSRDLLSQEIQLRLWAYLGEAIIRRAGGRWVLNDIKRDSAFGTPVVDYICTDFPRIAWADQLDRLEFDPLGAWNDLVSYAESEAKKDEAGGRPRHSRNL